MTLAEYRTCIAIARRLAGRRDEAEDLLQDALLAGIRAGRLDVAGAADRAWLVGTMRNLALARARGESRRRRRETRWTAEQPASVTPASPAGDDRDAILARLSEGTRRVAVLALHGLDGDEIQYVLGLKPAAFRQRLTALRRALGNLPEPLRAEALALAYAAPRRAGEPRLDVGLIRRALLHHLRASGGLGTHDPDGHLLALTTGGTSQSSPRRQLVRQKA
jgi:RNA polymerase sigma-70 factor (ECF subfamily)